MTTVTGYTAARMKAIEDGTVVSGQVIVDSLILTRHDGSTVNAGVVRGPQGVQGPPGTPGTNGTNGATGAAGAPGFVSVANQAARLALTGVPTGQTAIEQDTERAYRWNGTAWKWIVGTGTSPYLLDAWRSTSVALGSTLALIPFDTKTIDRATAYTASTGVYIAPVTGRYKFVTAILITIAAAGAVPVVGVMLNGTEVRRMNGFTARGITAGDAFYLEGYAEYQVTAGQSVGIGAASLNASSTVNPGQVLTWAQIDLVGY